MNDQQTIEIAVPPEGFVSTTWVERLRSGFVSVRQYVKPQDCAQPGVGAWMDWNERRAG